MFHIGGMDSLRQERVRDLALEICDRAAEQAWTGPVPRTPALRIALGCLALICPAAREALVRFWRGSRLPDDTERHLALVAAMLDIRYALGLLNVRQYMAQRVRLPVETKKGRR